MRASASARSPSLSPSPPSLHPPATLGAGDDAALFDRVSRLLDSTSTLEFAAIRRRLVRNFAPFSAAGSGRALPRRLDKPPLSSASLDAKEDAFLSDFHALLDAAHFRMLGAGEWTTAQAENFTFNSPVEVNWDALDTNLLSRFWAARPAERARAAPVADRILIYHRGMKTVKAEGRFIDDKVDLLVGYLVIGPLTRAVAAVGGLFKKRAAPATAPSVGDTSTAGADVALALQRAMGGGGGAPGAEAVSEADAAAEAAALAEELSHANAQVRRDGWMERGEEEKNGTRVFGGVFFFFQPAPHTRSFLTSFSLPPLHPRPSSASPLACSCPPSWPSSKTSPKT